MRVDEDGDPVAHRVQTEAEIAKEARLGLDELLARGRAEISRDARERAAKRLEDEAEISRQRRMKMAQLQADKFEWKPVAAGAMFETQTCRNCARVHTLFRGFGTLYQRKARFEEVWRAAECLDKGLPFQSRSVQGSTPCCIECVTQFAEEGNGSSPYEFHPTRKTEA